ncbi:MAG: Bug family tripartite tricarboxylate transporter substrate binding protein [Pigmentiphaga sp.]
MLKRSWIKALPLALGALAVCLTAGKAAFAAADSYPDKAVSLVIPFAPGGATDRLGRMVAQGLAQRWNTPVVVENRSGAGGNVGAEVAARAEPDGYTLLFTASNVFTVTPHLFRSSLDPMKAFAPVGMVATEMFTLVVPSALPVSNLNELLDLARSKPDSLTYGTPGVGSPHNLGNELLKSMADVQIRHVPYKGAAPAMPDLLEGRIDMWMGGVISVLPHIQSGALRALAVTGAERSEVLPEIPTMAEAGLSEYELTNWFAIVAPEGTDEAIVRKINQDVVAVMNDPALRESLAKEGIQATTSSPEELERIIQSDSERWGKVIRDAGIQVE